MSLLATTRRSLLGLIAGLPIFRLARAEAPDTFTLTPQFQPGQRLDYAIRSQQRRQGAVVQSSRSQVRLQVLAPHDDGWLMRWTARDSELLDALPPMRPMQQQLIDLWDGVAIDFLTDAPGRVQGLAEPEAMCARMAASVERLLDMMAADPARAPLRPHVQGALMPIVTNPVFLAQALLKEPTLLLGAMGRDYRVGEPLEVRSRIPSPLGTGEIPILGRFSVRSADASRASLGWLMVVDRHHAARTVAGELRPVLDTLAEDADAPPDTSALIGAALDGFDFDERGDYTVDTATGWPLQVGHERRTVSGGAERVDRIELTRLTA